MDNFESSNLEFKHSMFFAVLVIILLSIFVFDYQGPETASKIIKDNPFINNTSNALEYKCRSLIQNREQIMKSGNRGYKWVRKKHDISSVALKLYSYYKSIGLNP